MSGLYQRYMNMDGGGEKYTVDSIIEHKGRGVETLSNGAIAGYVQTADGPRWRIVQGASPQYMATIAKKRGVSKPVTQKQAQRAFNRYYNKKDENGKLLRGVRSRTYDLNHTRPADYVVDDQRFLRNPNRYDYEGVDTGDKVRAARSEKQQANDAKLRVARPFGPTMSMEGGTNCTKKKKAMGKPVDLKTAVNLLRNYYENKYE